MTENKPTREERRDNGRHFWRDQSHRASHSLAEPGPIQPHPLASGEQAIIVNTPHELTTMLDLLRSAGSFAFDSEFIGERTYEPQLCLVQAATEKAVFVVDPLGGLDLTPLWEMMADPSLEKIVLAGRQDFIPAVACTHRPPANIMDVQIAAGLVQAEYPLSLARLVPIFAGVALGKGLTFTHWDNRPLSAVQVRYAGDDVRYLLAARQSIGAKLAELGRTDWVRQECAAALEDVSLYRPLPEAIYQRVRGRDRLGRRQLAVLRELAVVRDQAARQENVPTRTLLKDGVLLAMARRPARSVANLAAVKGLPRPVEAKYGRQLVEAAARGLAAPETDWPPAEFAENPNHRAQVDIILAAIVARCLELSVAPALAASRKDVARLLHAAGTRQPLEQHRLMRGWRKELLGDLFDAMV